MRKPALALVALIAMALSVGSADASDVRTYTSANWIAAPTAGGLDSQHVTVNRNPGAYYGYVYLVQAGVKVRIYRPVSSTEYQDTGWSVLPDGPAGSLNPISVKVASDNSVWIMDATNRRIFSAPHPSPSNPSPTATWRVQLSADQTHLRNFAVNGTINAARLYVPAAFADQPVRYYDVNGFQPVTNPAWTSGATIGWAVAGITFDAAGNFYIPTQDPAGLIYKYSPTGEGPTKLAPKQPWMGATGSAVVALQDLDLVADASYSGGFYFLYSTRAGVLTDYKAAVYRFDSAGEYIDGFGPASNGSANLPPVGSYSVITLGFTSTSMNPYIGADSRGSIVIRCGDNLAGNTGNTGFRHITAMSPDYKAPGPWGDVDQDGFVTAADADLVDSFIADPASLSQPQRERIRRYGDINGTQNVSNVGDGMTDVNDLLRVARLASGIIDPGTAGPQYPHYGDVNDDGKVTVADVVTLARFLGGLEKSADVLARLHAAGVGDVYPTTQKVAFGDGQITTADSTLIRERAMGTEANAPAYQDYWPLIATDRYLFTDLNRRSGDALNQTTFVTPTSTPPALYPFDGRGYSITEVAGDDTASLAGVYKGVNGSIYALYAQFPYFSAQRMDFQSPMKVLDATRLSAGESWTGDVIARVGSFSLRPVHYKVTVLRVADTYTNGAGAYSTSAPIFSTWSKTVSIRIDVAVLGVPESPMEMQQAVFFDLAPGIGVVRRGQAPIQGMDAPTTDRPLLELDHGVIRGITYNQTTPTP